MNSTAHPDDIYRIIYTDHRDPFSVLGCHIVDVAGENKVVVRCFLPSAAEVEVCPTTGRRGASYKMHRVHDEGFFEVIVPGRKTTFPYTLRMVTRDGRTEEFYDSYSFLPRLTETDLYLFNAGDHHRIYEKLGAHYAEVGGTGGVQFAVWAPCARSASVIGEFNGWDRRAHAMRMLGASGIWEIFIPGLHEGALYKFHIKTEQGFILDKADPYGVEMEKRPRTASKVNFLGGFEWGDADWIAARDREGQLRKAVSVYEVHLGSWERNSQNQWLSYREIAEKLVSYVRSMGFTHIELLPVMEHPFDGSWGYQVTGYFAPTSRFGRPQDLMYLIDLCHRNGIGVLIDWVPAHFPRDMFALALFDGTHLYEHDDPRKGEHQDWGTYIFNYGRHEVRNFLLSNALFWIEKYHVDGVRIDAVASMLYLDYSRKEGEWIPNRYGGRENLEAVDFLRHLNSVVHHYYPGVLMIAEESTSWPGVTHPVTENGLGFDLKWNMGWMHDMLEYFSKDPVYRAHHQKNLTFALLYAFSERFILPLSHDEVVHGKRSLLDKMPGDVWRKFANLRALFGLMFGFPGKKLLFMGGEFGQWHEWSHERSLDWDLLKHEHHRGLHLWVHDLNNLYSTETALAEEDFSHHGFEWVDFHDAANSIISFERRSTGGQEQLLVVCNFTPVPRLNYRIGTRLEGVHRELLNSDATAYGGSNLGNYGEIHTEPVPRHNRPFSLSLTLPPLSVLYIKHSDRI